MARINNPRGGVLSPPLFAVFCSGFGSNLQAIIGAVRRKKMRAVLALVVSDRADAFALVRARRAGIAILVVDPADFSDRSGYEKYLVRQLRARKITHVVLAGFMRILSPYFVRCYRQRIVNIHPSLLPAFPGKDGIAAALAHGVKVSGVTVHVVDQRVDHGPIIAQQAIDVRPEDTRDSLAQRIHRVEYRIYPRVLSAWFENKVVIEGRKVRIDDGNTGSKD
ncbi:MAG: phosphoribosylglycinamide formyltransferase [Candidatus Omnitrophica bacterium]|nr:phosphoribosylglycinamide formyltransferase [Candidatus Omnitrophota bacterium]